MVLGFWFEKHRSVMIGLYAALLSPADVGHGAGQLTKLVFATAFIEEHRFVSLLSMGHQHPVGGLNCRSVYTE